MRIFQLKPELKIKKNKLSMNKSFNVQTLPSMIASNSQVLLQKIWQILLSAGHSLLICRHRRLFCANVNLFFRSILDFYNPFLKKNTSWNSIVFYEGSLFSENQYASKLIKEDIMEFLQSLMVATRKIIILQTWS